MTLSFITVVGVLQGLDSGIATESGSKSQRGRLGRHTLIRILVVISDAVVSAEAE